MSMDAQSGSCTKTANTEAESAEAKTRRTLGFQLMTLHAGCVESRVDKLLNQVKTSIQEQLKLWTEKTNLSELVDQSGALAQPTIQVFYSDLKINHIEAQKMLLERLTIWANSEDLNVCVSWKHECNYAETCEEASCRQNGFLFTPITNPTGGQKSIPKQ